MITTGFRTSASAMRWRIRARCPGQPSHESFQKRPPSASCFSCPISTPWAITFQRARECSRPLQEPLLLGVPGHRRRRVEARVAGRLLAVAAGVVRAVLARVQQAELGDVAVVQPPVELHSALLRPRAQRHRHVLEVGLVGGGAPREELGARVRELGIDARVVVVDLVVVPGDHPREEPVRLLEVRVGLVEGVLEAVALEGEALRRERRGDVGVSHAARADPVLVDVVAEVDDEVDVLLGHLPVRRCRTRRPTSGRTRTRT